MEKSFILLSFFHVWGKRKMQTYYGQKNTYKLHLITRTYVKWKLIFFSLFTFCCIIKIKYKVLKFIQTCNWHKKKATKQNIENNNILFTKVYFVGKYFIMFYRMVWQYMELYFVSNFFSSSSDSDSGRSLKQFGASS